MVFNSSDCKEIEIPEICPVCNERLINELTRLYCPNVSCPEKDIHRLRKWIEKLEIKHFGEKLIKKLLENGKIRK